MCQYDGLYVVLTILVNTDNFMGTWNTNFGKMRVNCYLPWLELKVFSD